MSAKAPIVISMSLAWGVRNVLRSGLYENLANDFRIICAIPEEAQADMLKEGIPADDLLILKQPSYSRKQTALLNILKAAHRYNHPIPDNQVLDKWKHTQKPLKAQVRDTLYDTLGYAARYPVTMPTVKRWYQAAERANVPEIGEQLDRIQPIAALSTSFVNNREWSLFAHLHARNVPSVMHVLSHDNLTSRSYLPMEGFNAYMVWHERMGRELVDLYDVPPKLIDITGTPQFDFHVQESSCWSHEETIQALGIPADTPYFVYNANHERHTPTEPEFVKVLLQNIRDDEVIGKHHWILRPHPLDDYTRWKELNGMFPNLTISYPWQQGQVKRGWGIPTSDDINRLSNTYRYADATLSVASTTSLDTAIVDTPVICVGFHPTAPEKEQKYYHDVHFSHHYRPIINSGAIDFTQNMDDMHQALRSAVQEPARLQTQRQQLVEKICGLVDGHATERIAAWVRKIAEE